VHEQHAHTDFVCRGDGPEHYVLKQRSPEAPALMSAVDRETRKEDRRNRSRWLTLGGSRGR
jgi:hypothetical protein